jgi:transcriptional antiterminator NusG
MAMKWYVVTPTRAREQGELSLMDRVRQAGLNDRFGEVLIPTDTVVELVKGRSAPPVASLPGYMFVQMDLDQETFHLVKNTPKITGFLGGMNPQPIKETEIQNINTAITEGTARSSRASPTRGRQRAGDRGAVRELLGRGASR